MLQLTRRLGGPSEKHRASTLLQRTVLAKTFQMETHFRTGVVVVEDGREEGGAVVGEEGELGDTRHR